MHSDLSWLGCDLLCFTLYTWDVPFWVHMYTRLAVLLCTLQTHSSNNPAPSQMESPAHIALPFWLSSNEPYLFNTAGKPATRNTTPIIFTASSSVSVPGSPRTIHCRGAISQAWPTGKIPECWRTTNACGWRWWNSPIPKYALRYSFPATGSRPPLTGDPLRFATQAGSRSPPMAESLGPQGPAAHKPTNQPTQLPLSAFACHATITRSL